MNDALAAALSPPPKDRPRALTGARLAVVAAAVSGVALVALLRAFDLAAPSVVRGVGALAAAAVGARLAIAVTDVTRGQLPWTRLPFAAAVAGEVAIGALGFPPGAALAHVALALLEVGVIVCAVVAAARRSRAPGSSSPLEERIAAELEHFVPAAIARVVAFELGVLRAAFGPRSVAPPGDRSFAYADEGPVKMVLLAYPLLALGDQLVAVVCIPARLVAAHVAVVAVGIYGAVWLLGVYRSMVARPHVLEGLTLRLHRGVLGSALVPLEDIVSAARIDEEAVARLGSSTGRLDLGGARVLLALRRPVACRGALRTREVRTLLVSADDPGALCAALEHTTG